MWNEVKDNLTGQFKSWLCLHKKSCAASGRVKNRLKKITDSNFDQACSFVKFFGVVLKAGNHS